MKDIVCDLFYDSHNVFKRIPSIVKVGAMPGTPIDIIDYLFPLCHFYDALQQSLDLDQ